MIQIHGIITTIRDSVAKFKILNTQELNEKYTIHKAAKLEH